MNKSDKGKQFGSCNVTHCQKDNSAFYFNKVTNAYYCRDCAVKIYKANPDMDLFDIEELRKHKCLTAECLNFVDSRDFCPVCVYGIDSLKYIEN